MSKECIIFIDRLIVAIITNSIELRIEIYRMIENKKKPTNCRPSVTL